MADLINREILKKELIKRWNRNDDHDFSNKEVWEALENAPSAKPPPETCWGCNCPKMEEPKRGKWEKQLTRHFLDSRANVGVEMKEATGRGYHIYVNLKCTNCNKVTMVSESIIYKFCPHCGAKMEMKEVK